MMPIRMLQRKNFPQARGFSLVEMMMVVLVIGIVSSLSVPPLFRYIASHSLRTSADRMASDLQYARSIAISNAKILDFTTSTTGYVLKDALSNDVLLTINLDSDMALDSVQSVNFYPWGMADDTVFTVSSSAGSYDLNLLPTGIVEVAVN